MERCILHTSRRTSRPCLVGWSLEASISKLMSKYFELRRARAKRPSVYIYCCLFLHQHSIPTNTIINGCASQHATSTHILVGRAHQCKHSTNCGASHGLPVLHLHSDHPRNQYNHIVACHCRIHLLFTAPQVASTHRFFWRTPDVPAQVAATAARFAATN